MCYKKLTYFSFTDAKHKIDYREKKKNKKQLRISSTNTHLKFHFEEMNILFKSN